MTSFLRSLQNVASAASDALLGRAHSKPSAAPAAAVAAAVAIRPVCMYGARCYRKNPQHRADECHPGDADHPDTVATTPAVTKQPSASAQQELKATDDSTSPARVKRASSRRHHDDSADASPAPGSASNPSPHHSDAASSPTASAASSDEAPLSPRVDKKMSVRDRKRLQQQQQQQRREQEGAEDDVCTRALSLNEAAAAAPASLPPLPVQRGLSLALDGDRAAASATAATAADGPLLASLHALYRCPSIPEFTEIRESALDASNGGGRIYIGRSAQGKNAHGEEVPVSLQLQSDEPRLAKMISRVHASISWEREQVKHPSCSGGEDNAPVFSYKFFIEDEGSMNGIFVNNIKQPSGMPASSRGGGSRGARRQLHRRDRIIFGGGLNVAAGESRRQKIEEAQFVFEWNAIQRRPEVSERKEDEDEDEDEDKQQPVSSARSKRAHASSAASSSSSSHALKRRRTGQETSGNSDADDSSAVADAPPAAAECATQDFGASLDPAAASAAATQTSATQEYVDEERDDHRSRAQDEATQDFGAGGGGGGHEHEHAGAGATQEATQDGDAGIHSVKFNERASSLLNRTLWLCDLQAIFRSRLRSLAAMATLRRRNAQESNGGDASESQAAASPASISAAAASPSAAATAARTESVPVPLPRASKSLLLAYVLWLVGGWCGLHHAYLGRDGQAVLYAMTCGGFLVGWMRDLWRLPEYVAFANGSYECVETLKLQMRLRPKRPAWSLSTLVAQVLCGWWLGELGGSALDLMQVSPVPRFPSVTGAGGWNAWMVAMQQWPHMLRIVSVILRVVSVCVGAWLAGNAHRKQYSALWPIILWTLLHQLLQSLTSVFEKQPPSWLDPSAARAETDRRWVVIIAAVMAYYGGNRWSDDAYELVGAEALAADANIAAVVARLHLPLPRRRRRPSFCFRARRYMAACGLFWLLLTSYILNCSVDDVPIKTRLAQLRSDPNTQELLRLLHIQWVHFRRTGFNEWFEHVRTQVRASGVDESYRTLELDPTEADSITPAQLRKARNTLALQYHPDKTHPDTEHMTRAEKESHFTRVQQAYEKIVNAREAESKGGSEHSGAAPRSNSGTKRPAHTKRGV